MVLAVGIRMRGDSGADPGAFWPRHSKSGGCEKYTHWVGSGLWLQVGRGTSAVPQERCKGGAKEALGLIVGTSSLRECGMLVGGLPGGSFMFC